MNYNNIAVGQMYFDRQYNLLYLFANPAEETTPEPPHTGSFWTKKAAAVVSSFREKQETIANLLIYDIPKDLQVWLFKAGELLEDECLVNLLFEQYYDAAEASMQISSSQSSLVVNNFKMTQRPVNDQLLVETWSAEKEQTRLWVSDKWGFQKKIICTLGKNASWHLDVFNSVVRVFEKTEKGTLSIKNFDW